MDDTISREWLIEAVEEGWIKFDTQEDYNCIIHLVRDIAPSVQQEIIRCKDCKHWDTSWQNDFAPNYHYCPLVDGTRRDDFYCADAERRGEQDE